MKLLHGMYCILFVFISLFLGCSPKSSDVLVLEVGQQKVPLSEYENFYLRNSPDWDAASKSSMSEREHFLDLLTNYKLKLQDAYDHHINEDSDIVSELNDYRSSLATNFLLDKEVTTPGVKQLYERRREEIRAQHILLRVTPDAKPEDTLAAYAKAANIISRAKAGTNFDSLALRYSEDPSVKDNKGDLYYFSGGEMVGAFENGAYALHKGEISPEPIRSPFGYHVLKITDRQPSRGTIKVSHIMARFKSPTPDSADVAAAMIRIKGIQDSLKKGWDFHKLAIKMSEDGGSASLGGSLGWFGRRHFVQPFDEAAFKLKAGEVSGIVRTPFGYHLILCDSAKPFGSFESMTEDMKKTYQQTRYQDDYKTYINGLKKEYNYFVNDKVLDELVAQLDSSKTTDDSAWSANVSQSVRSKPVILLNGKSYSVDTVLSILNTKQDYRSTPLRKSSIANRLDQIGESVLLETKSTGLEARDPKFHDLMKEYGEGIVLYKAQQNEVWSKTGVSDSVLRAYYQTHSDSFMIPARVNISVLVFDNDTLAYIMYDSLRHGANFSTLAALYREDPNGKTSDGSRGMQPITTDDLTRRADSLSIGDITEPIALDNGAFAVVKLIDKKPAEPKTYEDAGAEVSNAYQDYISKKLEQEWVDRIKLRYPVVQFKDALLGAFHTQPAQ